jgi:nascent polypeptide-associated complex subunit alpha
MLRLRRVNPREARRMMQRMGLSMNPLEVQEVILKTKDKEITIENPEVAVLEVQGQKIFQVAGGEITEKSIEKKATVPEEDVQLVAQQAKVSLDQARAALEQTNGDLAQAILLLSQD